MSATTAAATPLGGVLTPRMERRIRIASIGSAVVIAVSAMILSYSGLLDLALDAQIHPRLALLVPIMVDGLQFVGSLGVVYSTLSGLRSWYPWLLMLMGVSISAWGNWQAAPDALTAKLLHAAAPVILALVLEELLRVMRHKVEAHAAAHAALMAEAASEESTEETPAPVVDSETAQPPVVEPVESSIKSEGQADGEALNRHPLVESDPSPTPETSTVEPLGPVVEPTVEPSRGTPTGFAPTTLEPVMGPPRWQDQTSQWAAQADAEGQRLAEAMEAASPTGTQPVTQGTVVQPAPSPVRQSVVEPAVEPTRVRDSSDDDSLPDYPSEAPFKEQIRAILIADPEILASKIARVMGKDGSYTRKTVRTVKAELDEAATQPTPPSQPASQNTPHRVVPSPVSVREQASSRPGAGDDLSGADPFAVGTPVLAGRD